MHIQEESNNTKMIEKSSPPNSLEKEERQSAVGFRNLFMLQIHYIIWEYKAVGTFKKEAVNKFI